MSDFEYTPEELAAFAEKRRDALMERQIQPLEIRISRLRAEIRAKVRHVRALQARGYPAQPSVRVLKLLCRTLAARRRYRDVLLRQIVEDTTPMHR